MNPQPPYGHNSSHYQDLSEKVEALWQITNDILTHSKGEDLPTLGQLVLRRGIMLDQLSTASLNQLSQEKRAPLQEKLDACKQLDVTIEHNMRTFQHEINTQLKSLKQNKNLMSKYKLGGENQDSAGHSTDA